MLTALILTGYQPAGAQDNVIDEVVWVVGDEPILRSEVENQRLQSQLEGIKFDGDPYCVIPEQLAIQKLYLHQADLDSIDVDESEIVTTVDRQLNRSIAFYGSKEKLEEYARKPISRLREMWREQARVQNIMGEVQRNLIGDVKVTPAEIRQYYKSLPEDSIPTIPGEVEVEIITVEPNYDQEEVEAIKERLRGFTERINNGESFATLALMYSEDRGTSRVGGEMGFVGKAELVPEFANVAFSLSDPKRVSKIVETEYGFHIIQLIEKLGDRINCRHILLKPRISAVERNKALQRLDSIADLIRNQKLTFGEAAQYYSADKDTRKNGGLMVNPQTLTSRFKLEELPQDVGKAVYQMNVGEISAPFTMRLENKDKEICAIIRVKTKTKPHKASLTEDFQALKDLLLEKKRNDIIDEWIKAKQAKTYIRISENWRNCTFKYPGWIRKAS
ncbi:MAG: peptidylprolyl isomerase [Bacteroidales bacterium]|nr:peptidylprolyl isomerase [Bacteroidales bacterium]